MDGEDLELFTRSLRQATSEHTGPALDAALEDVGWYDAVSLEPRAAIATLFDLQGTQNVTSSALGYVVRHALGLGHRSLVGVVLPAIGRWDPPGILDDRDLRVDGLAPAALRHLASAVIMASSEGGVLAFEVPTASLTLIDVHGIDPHSAMVRVTGTNVPPENDLRLTASDWTSAVTRARLALSHELVGCSRTMLELAREHALGRVQFGRPISSFQAIRHQLAETLVAIEMADALLDAAWLETTTHSAAMAKAAAGRQARTAARHSQQVLAGIGFTTEHSLHRLIQRMFLLDGLFGTAVSITRSLGEELLHAGKLPPLLPL